ncbi:hypothetical protein [Sebaldella termitidis]|uniref:hypothetical protein n=1 Tax=Sebaldella termitidis TaxID=826 RepID=UPI003EBBB3F4
MKKFYWLLFFLTLFMGSTNKANTVVNKSDKVIKILEDNLSSFYKENANKQALFCGDIDSILEGDREGLYSFYLRKTKNDIQEKFKEEYKDYLEKHSVAKSVKELEEAYFFPYLHSIYIERPFVIFRMIRKDVLNVIDHDIKYYKIFNLHYIWFDSMAYLKDYDTPERLEILNNDNLEWQKNKYQEFQKIMKENTARQSTN